MFQGTTVYTQREIYTPSSFAKASLLYLQEAGSLTAVQPHSSSRSGLESYLFFTVNSGSGTLHYGGNSYPLKQGDCVFIDCRLPYSHAPFAHDLWQLQWVHFDGAAMAGIYEKYRQRGGSPVFEAQGQQDICRLLTELMELASSEDYIRDMRINEKLNSLLTLIMAHSWNPENTSKKQGLKKQTLQQICSYLEDNYNQKLTLDSIAEQFYISKFYLARSFREQYDTTLMTYLNGIRITHAKQLLRFSGLSAEEVGRRVGIDEPGYFNRLFKKTEGVTPGEYRKRW